MTNLHDDKKMFNDVLIAAAQPMSEGGIGINLVMLEKDYWLTRALQLLAESQFVEQAVFKGDTSLSKACGVGYRFSEDIDIAITSDPSRSDNQTKNLIGDIDKVMSMGLEEVGMPDTRKFSKYRKVFYHYPTIDNAQRKENKAHILTMPKKHLLSGIMKLVNFLIDTCLKTILN